MRNYLKKRDYTDFVNTNIGTYGHLLTACYPIVQSPHGSGFISPEFTPGSHDNYVADKIYGFKVGGATIMPTCNDSFDMDVTASIFDHDLETAKPDIYEVLLEDFDIYERHTSYENYGVFEFDFKGNKEDCYVLITGIESNSYKIDGNKIYINGLNGRNRLNTMFVFDNIISAEQIETKIPDGYNKSLLIDASAIKVKVAKGKNIVRFTVSAIGFEGCEKTYNNLVANKTFDEVYSLCNNAWNGLLSKIDIKTDDEDLKTCFYTAFYRATSRMHNYSEDGDYLGYDNKVHHDELHGFYCDDGVWDTYRGAHPLQLLVEPKVHRDIVLSLLNMYKQSGELPRFPYVNGDIPCMLGQHNVAVLADSLVKDVDFDVEEAYEACKKSLTERTALPWKNGKAEELSIHLFEKGYLPALADDEEETNPNVHEFENRQAVAVTLEFAYDNWCIAQIAKYLKKDDEAEIFLNRATYYKNLYNKDTGFMHPKNEKGEWIKGFNPKLSGGQGGRRYFAENNSYIYTFNVQHDVKGLADLMGGDEELGRRIDNLFAEQSGINKYTFLDKFPDSTGLMGLYCQGNEPSFHIPYMYNYIGQSYKTQRRTREIITMWYLNHPLGICGDEDGGAMSAWLVFSAIGLYPVCPGSDEYAITSPISEKTTIEVGEGRTFTIIAKETTQKKKYIQSAKLNGKKLTRSFIKHSDIINGGELVLEMGLRPNKSFGIE